MPTVPRLLALCLLTIAVASPLAAQPRFDGTEITVVVQDAVAIGNPIRSHARTWEARTGGRVKVVAVPFAKLFDEIARALATDEPVYDVLTYASGWAGDFAPALSQIPAAITDNDAFDDIHSVYRDRLMSWRGNWNAITIDGDLFNGYYRKDLLTDPLNRQAFERRFGYPLAPPDTWAQYADIAAFFDGRIDADGHRLVGAAEAFARGRQSFWYVFARAAAYTNHPSCPGAQFFDPQTMTPQIANPGWQRAVSEYREIVRHAGPDALSNGLEEIRARFVSGGAALALDWGDTAQMAASGPQTEVADKVGYFVLPGTLDVWNTCADRWERFPLPHKAPFLAFGGWVASVPRASRHPDAAWDFIAWLSSPENSLLDVVSSETGINPYRLSHFIAIDAWSATFPEQSAMEFLNVIRRSLDSPNAALDLRLPGFAEYTNQLEIWLERILRGEVSCEAGLAAAAAAWDTITDRRGRDAQRALYRAAMGLSQRG